MRAHLSDLAFTTTKRCRASCSKALGVLVLLSLASCSTYSERTAAFRSSYWNHDFAGADREISELYAKEASLSTEDVMATNGLDVNMRPSDTDEALLLLEMAMNELALGKPDVARNLLLRCRDVLDDSLRTNTVKSFSENAGASLSDDNALDHTPFDYDHILLRVMLCLCELIADGRDAQAYAYQIGEIQERILGTPFEFAWKDGSYNPRENYKSIGAGAYLEGVVADRAGNADASNSAFRRFLQMEPSLPIAENVRARIDDVVYAEEGHGVLHVFYLGGRGPTLASGEEEATGTALKIAGIVSAFATNTLAPAFQKQSISVPVVQVNDDQIPELRIASGDRVTATRELLDVNSVAINQLQANMPAIMGRAVVRRVLKGAVAAGTEAAISRSGGHHRHNDADSGRELAGAIAGVLISAIWTSAERADTRIWSALPSRIEAARLELPDGENRVVLDGKTEVRVKIAKGYPSYLLVIRPNVNLAPVVLVDKHSRVEELKLNEKK